MKTWTTVTGYPYLKVTEEKWSNDSVTITLEQNRFLSDGSVDESSSSTLWSIPLLFASEGNASDEAVIMDKKVQTFTIPISSSSNTKVRISDIFSILLILLSVMFLLSLLRSFLLLFFFFCFCCLLCFYWFLLAFFSLVALFLGLALFFLSVPSSLWLLYLYVLLSPFSVSCLFY
jgi:hypothetical protein